jgi:hypothetical protein
VRTTLSIDDDVLSAARAIALQTDRSVGEVISELARRGLRPAPEPSASRGLPCFNVSEKARPLTPDAVRRAQDDEE